MDAMAMETLTVSTDAVKPLLMGVPAHQFWNRACAINSVCCIDGTAYPACACALCGLHTSAVTAACCQSSTRYHFEPCHRKHPRGPLAVTVTRSTLHPVPSALLDCISAIAASWSMQARAMCLP